MVLIKILLLVILTTAVSCNDLHLGDKWGGKLIFNETFEANPALWTREENVYVDAKRTIINKIIVVDHRPNKDGVASVIDGGIHFNNVTIHLESPSIFRGYSFSVKVYAVNKTAIPSFVTTRKPGHAIVTRLPVKVKAPVSSTSNILTISPKEASTTTKMLSTTVSSTPKPHVSSTTNSETISSTTKQASTATIISSTSSPSVNSSSAKTNETLSSIPSQSPITSKSNSVTKEPITATTNRAWCKLFGCVFHDSRGTNEEPPTTEDNNGLKPKEKSNKDVLDSRKKELQEDYDLDMITDRIY